MTIKRLLRSLAFITLGIVLFSIVQFVLSRKWFSPVDGDNHKYTFEEFYDITRDSEVQAIFLGPSHVFCGINPMMIYQDTGIATYDLASSAQPIEASRAILEDALSRSSPKCVFLDASNFFLKANGRFYFRRVLDNIAFSPAKIRLAFEYAMRYGEGREFSVFLGALLPIYEYHNRWEELSEIDFSDGMALNLYKKGGNSTAVRIKPAKVDVETMNAEDEQRLSQASVRDPKGGKETDDSTQTFAGREIKTASLEYLMEMKRMCDEAGVALYLFKIPTLEGSSGGWTRSKSNAIKEMCAEYDIPFLDLLYDYDLSLDWSTDTLDGGTHLNTNGARKVTAFMSAFLQDECGLKAEANRHYEADMPIYNDVDHYVELLTAQNMTTYLDMLSQLDDLCVFFSASKDMRDQLKPEDMAALNAFGMKTEFDKLAHGDAYIAIVDDGELIYEAYNNVKVGKEGELEDGLKYLLYSGGLYSDIDSMIRLGNKEYSLNDRGLNIVVVNKESHVILDRVCFDTSEQGEQLAARYDSPSVYLREYSDWRAREDYRRGIR